MKYKASRIVVTFIGSQMSEWTSWRRKSVLIALLKGFPVLFLARQYSYVGKFMLSS